MKGKKIIATVVVLTMIFSAMVVLNQVTDFKIVGKASAATTTAEISDNGTRTVGAYTLGLYPGQLIEYKVTDNSLNASEKYYVKVANVSGNWTKLKFSSSSDQTSDAFGDLTFMVHVPGWTELDANPIGQWNISLFDKDGTKQTDNTTIHITNMYAVKYKNSNGTEIPNLVYNTSYTPLYVEIYNWSGSSLVKLGSDDDPVIVNLTYPDGTYIFGSNVTSGKFTVNLPRTYTDFDDNGNKEMYYWVNVINKNDATQNSTIPLPVKLDVTFGTFPSGKVWGDDITISGRILDGQDMWYEGYPVKLYAPESNGQYTLVYSTDTDPYGYFSVNALPTGTGETGHAGTWYIGTEKTGTYRIDETDTLNISNFISYGHFTLASKATSKVKVRNTDAIVSDFDQTINVSVYNETWMDNNEYKQMKIYVTGLDGWYGGKEYDKDDKVLMTTTNWTDSNEKYCYYEFEWNFNQSGTATIIATYPINRTEIQKTASLAGVDSDEEDLLPDIIGTTTFSVVSPGAMTVLVDNVPEAVEKEDAACGSGWVNKTTAWTNISVYGSTQNTNKNATIKVSGCGLSYTINESDTVAGNEYLLDKGWNNNGGGAWYNVSIIPKRAGTLTITVTNDTNDPVVKDYAVTGLTGTVTTSIGDDLKITVGTTETITLTGVNPLAETKITFFNENWECVRLLNESEDSGEFSFTPDVDDIDQVGHIVVVTGATVYGLYMYDIIDVVPVYDLTVDVTTPTVGNQTLTVGYEQDVVVHLIDSQNNSVTEDTPTVIGKLVDDDHNENDPLQTFSFSNSGGGEFEATIHPYWAGQLIITGYNASSAIKHSGNVTLDVDYATITYAPAGTTAGIGVENLTVNVSAVDANGNALEDMTIYLWVKESNTITCDDHLSLTDGIGEFDIGVVGDNATTINATLQNNDPSDGNKTLGVFTIAFPTFQLNPDTIYIGKSNLIVITAKDYAGAKLDGIWLTLSPTQAGTIAEEPDPVETDADGMAEFSVDPSSSGKLNVTIIKDINDRTQDITTDTYVTVTHLRELTMTFSKSPIYEGETLTVTVKSGESPVKNVNVTFGINTKKTEADGTATFEVPDPGVDSAIYDVEAKKTGYTTATKSITVINKWDISIIAPSGKIETGKSYTFTIVAKGQPLAGATITFNDKTYTSDGDGKITLTMPDTKGEYTVTATFPNYIDKKVTFTVSASSGTPGFELLTLIAALGVAFILLRRRRH